jgi:hypothetical protein
MPSARSKHAPSFSGDIDETIEDFLQEYEELADSCNLTNRQKVETIIRYVDPSQRDLWKSLQGFIDHDWDDLCRDLCHEYVNPTPQGRYSKQKLLDLTNRSSGARMEDEGDVIRYYRAFNLLSKPLLDAGRITTGERNAAFLLGFHPEDVKALRERLIAKKPDTLKGRTFDIKDVLDTTRAIFSGDDDLFLPPTRASRHKDKSPEEEEKELDELIRKLYSYSVRDMEYTAFVTLPRAFMAQLEQRGCGVSELLSSRSGLKPK